MTFDSAGNGNVAQMGWLELGDPRATSVSFDVVLASAPARQALDAAEAALGGDLDAAQRRYDAGWQAYAAGLSDQAAAPTTATTWRR